MDELKNAIAAVAAQSEKISAALKDHPVLESYAAWRDARKSAEAFAINVLTNVGAVIKEDFHGASIKLAGIRSTSTGGLNGALGNWLRAAKARLAKMEAGHG